MSERYERGKNSPCAILSCGLTLAACWQSLLVSFNELWSSPQRVALTISLEVNVHVQEAGTSLCLFRIC